MSGILAGLYHAHDTARGAGKNRVFSLEKVGVGQPAVRLHEEQALRASSTLAGLKRIPHALNVTPQNRT